MDRHFNVVLFADRLDGLQKIHQVVEEYVRVHVLIQLEQLLDAGHALRLPSGQLEAVGLLAHGLKHVLRIQLVDLLLVVGQNRGTVRAHLRQVGTGPVEHRHKVVANHMDIGLSQALQGGDIVGYVLLALRNAHLDGVMDVHALDSKHLQALGLHLLLHLKNALHRPGLSGRNVVQGGDHTLHPGNLTNLLQGHTVHTLAEPT